MRIRLPKRFSVSAILLLTAIVAVSIWWAQGPAQTANELSIAIESQDRAAIRQVCVPLAAERIISELDHNPYEEMYTPEYWATIRHSTPQYAPEPSCTINPRTWRQILGRSTQFNLRINGRAFLVNVKGTRAVSVEKRNETISFTYPLLR